MKKKYITLLLMSVCFCFAQAQTTHFIDWEGSVGANATITIDVGDTIEWTNIDLGMPHDVTSSDPNAPAGFGSGLMGDNDTYSFTFNTAVVFDYGCSFHPGTMDGTITVLGAPPVGPPNDDCTDAIMLTVGTDFADQQVVGTNENATNDPNDPIPDCDDANFATNGKDVWYTVVVPASGLLKVETRSNADPGMNDTGLQIYSGTCGNITSIECNADGGIGNFSIIELSGQTPGQTLLVRVWGYNLHEGEFLISAYDDFVPGAFPQPYCGPLTFPSGVEPITNVVVAGINNTSSNVVNGSPAHEDFTLIMGTMEQGGTYSIDLEGNTDGNYTNYFTVFIDWNQNDDLDDAGEIYEIGSIFGSTGIDGQQATGTIIVPVNADLGQTRMRVFKNFNTSVIDPCDGTGYGQVEDYTIEVIPAGTTTCDAPTNLTVNNVTDTTADFSWTASPDETGGYSWVVMEMGDDPNTDPPVDQGTVATGISTAAATGLSPDTMYQAYVKTICDMGLESDFSSPLDFETDEQMSVNDNQWINLSYYPNPTSGVLTLDARTVIESVEVYTLKGQRVLLSMENQQTFQLDLSDLAQGIYMLKASFDGGAVRTFRIIKQ